MKDKLKTRCSLLMAVIVLFSTYTGIMAADSTELDKALADTAEYVYHTVQTPQVGSVGGEWAVIGLARSEYAVDENYYQNYYRAIEDYAEQCGGNLHDKKYTEYSRVILALTAIGKDPRNVAGYNLLTALGDYERTIWQGINGPIWALIALDSGNYDIPQNPAAKTQATRELYITRILECQLSDGGWSLTAGADSAGQEEAEPDITAMALQALAKYQDRDDVNNAIKKALNCMTSRQNESGGFSGRGKADAESSIQMLVALCELGIPVNNEQFVKNGNTLYDHVMTYYEPGKGFKHTPDDKESNQMASEQGLYGLTALQRQMNGKNSLYRMSDASAFYENTNTQTTAPGLPAKHQDVCIQGIKNPGKTFADIHTHFAQKAIEALASRGIINGMSEEQFAPDATMTRAEFAAIIVKGLGLPTDGNAVFWDVTEQDWFYSYVNTAYAYGIVSGISEHEFNPNGTITREEAAVMIARSARLCGMNTQLDMITRDILSAFTDYMEAEAWAMPSLAFCYKENILSDELMEIKPKQQITRAEVAQMLFNLLTEAKLL